MMTVILRLVRVALTTLVIGYLGIAAVLAFLENRFVYHPATAAQDWMPPPSDEIEELELAGGDGTRLGAWWLPCAGSDRCVLYLHGNAGNLSHRGGSIVKMRKLLDASVLIVDYPGYGKSGGEPSEKGCYLAADAGYDFLIESKKRDPKKLVIYGGSLGGAVAIDLAARKRHQALVVVKSFTSAPDVGGRWFPWLPVRWIMRNQFRSIDKVTAIRTPVFVAHGDNDRVVPFEQGEALFRAANQPKEFYRLKGQDHNDPLPADVFLNLRAFLEKHS